MRAAVFLAFLGFLGLAGAAQAQGRYEGPQPLDRVLPEIRRNTPGTFYDAQGPFFDADGQAHYRIKWMTPDGRIVWFDADARTGRILGGGGRLRDRDDYPPRAYEPRNFQQQRPQQYQQRDQRGYPPHNYHERGGRPSGYNGGGRDRDDRRDGHGR